MQPQEEADITRVDECEGVTRVRGYQNYNIHAGYIEPLREGHAWANSYTKWKVVDTALDDLVETSLIDVGCNLGLYVLSAEMKQGMDAEGVDYNKAYIDVCDSVARRYGLKSTFSCGSFLDAEPTGRSVLVALGLVHHLFHRTEMLGSLESVMEHLHTLTGKWAIVEFPTERDRWGKHWTTMEGRPVDEPYTQQGFERHASAMFRSHQIIGHGAPERPIYLLGK